MIRLIWKADTSVAFHRFFLRIQQSGVPRHDLEILWYLFYLILYGVSIRLVCYFNFAILNFKSFCVLLSIFRYGSVHARTKQSLAIIDPQYIIHRPISKKQHLFFKSKRKNISRLITHILSAWLTLEQVVNGLQYGQNALLQHLDLNIT